MAKKRHPIKPADKDEFVIARLRRVLTRLSKQYTWSQISDAIRTANGGEGHATIDRRTLPLLCKEEEFAKVQLTLSQLVGLDKYFESVGEGPLFARNRSLVDEIAESPAAAFFVGAKYHKALYNDAVTAPDLRAVTTLMTTRLGRLDISINVISSTREWRRAMAGSEQIATLGIGSPIANEASDAMLSKMIGFTVTENTRLERLPFFIVRKAREKKIGSGFLRNSLAAVKRNADAANAITKDARALVIEDQVFVSSNQIDYALLVAQRDPDSGQVRTVLCGLTGLGTLELARVLQSGKPMIELPELRRNETHPPILAVVYKLSLEGRKSTARNAPDKRKIAGSTPVYGPTFLNHSDNTWRSAVGISAAE